MRKQKRKKILYTPEIIINVNMYVNIIVIFTRKKKIAERIIEKIILL